ncbi:MAG: hypothetical protein JKX95_06390 [Bacteroidia bacterium]|nr:hypothetical protein [Bacteroidia bacterium]
MKNLIMNHSAFIILLSITFLISCNKNDDADDTDTEVWPTHCSNGIQDQFELDVDCGGSCESCGTIVAPCSSDSNTASLTSFSTLNVTYTNGEVDRYDYEITCNASEGDIIFRFENGRPTEDRAYRIISSTSFWSDNLDSEGKIKMCKGFSGCFYSSSGKLYVEMIGDSSFAIKFCDVEFGGDQTSGDFTGSGYIIHTVD